jgi:hypothetical protein
MHVRLAGKAVLKAAKDRLIPLTVTSAGLTMRVRWLRRRIVVGGRRSDMTGLGRNGLAIKITATVSGAVVDVRTRVPHGWADQEVIDRVALVMGRAKALLKLEKRKVERRKRRSERCRL